MIGKFSTGAVVGVAGLTSICWAARPTIDTSADQIEWLGQIVVGAAFGSSDRRHDRVLGAHDDNRQARASAS